jgi:hypothetical protein
MRKPICHQLTPIVTHELEKTDDNLFVPLQSTDFRWYSPFKMPSHFIYRQPATTGSNGQSPVAVVTGDAALQTESTSVKEAT